MRTALSLLFCALVAPAAAAQSSFVNWESAHVHPLDLTPDGSKLLAVNTADARLLVYDVTGASLVLLSEIPSGSIRSACARAATPSAWVVNQISDTVSVVDLSTRQRRGHAQHRRRAGRRGLRGLARARLRQLRRREQACWSSIPRTSGARPARDRDPRRPAARAGAQPRRHQGLCRDLRVGQPLDRARRRRGDEHRLPAQRRQRRERSLRRRQPAAEQRRELQPADLGRAAGAAQGRPDRQEERRRPVDGRQRARLDGHGQRRERGRLRPAGRLGPRRRRRRGDRHAQPGRQLRARPDEHLHGHRGQSGERAGDA